MISRRGFLSLLGVGTAGLVAVDALPEFLVYEPAKLIVPAEGALVGVNALAQAVAVELERALAGYNMRPAILTPKGVRLGDTIGGAVMDHRRYVEWALPPGREIPFRDSYARTTAHMLADDIRHKGITQLTNVFVPPQLPDSVRIGTGSNGAVWVRGCVYYDIEVDADRLRFDIMGGQA